MPKEEYYNAIDTLESAAANDVEEQKRVLLIIQVSYAAFRYV